MSKIAHQPGKRLAPSNGGIGPRRWQGTTPTVTPAAVPTGELYDAHGWQPNGTHRKTGTSVNPEGVPFSFSKALREAQPAVSEAEVIGLHRAHVPTDYAAEGLRNGLPVAEIEEAHAEHAPRSALRPRRAPRPTPVAVEQAGPLSKEDDPDWELREVPVVKDGILSMQNRWVMHQDRDEAHRSDRERFGRSWPQRKERPVEPWQYAPMPLDPDGVQPVRIPWNWREIRSAAKRLGAKWSGPRKVWRMTPEAAAQLRPLIEQRAAAERRKA